jgi:hypothetical protein
MHHWVGGGVPKSFDGYKDLLKRGYKPGIKVTLSSIQNDPKKRIVKWALAVQNKYAGHWMPTADPERFLLLHATLLDPKQVARKRTKHRIGQTWKWEPMAQKVGDNRLKPNETRTWNASFALPTQHKGYTLRLQVYHVRLSSQTAAYMQSHAHKYKSAPLAIRNKIAQLSKHYPMATVLYRLDIQLDTNKQRSYSRKELIQLSAQEQHKPLKLRDF